MAKPKSNATPAESAGKTVKVPVRRSIFRFADVGRGPVKLGSHQTIHGAD